MNSSPRPRRHAAGFTLVEVMIATAISGVLASVAYPSFSGAMHKVKRCEALAALMQLEQAEERWRSDNSRYGSLNEVGVASVAPGRNYLLSVADPSATGYVAAAQATGTQAGDRKCQYLRLTFQSGDLATASGETESADNDAQANRQCWNQ